MADSLGVRLAVGLALASVATACGATHTQAPAVPSTVEHGLAVRDPALIVRPAGEELVARAELVGIHVGQLLVRLGPFCARPEEPRLESRFASAGMARWIRKADGTGWATFHPETLLPQKSRFELLNGDKWRNYDLAFTRTGYRFSLETSTGKPSEGGSDLDGPDPYYDVHTAFLLVRSWQAEPGEETYFYVVLGKDPWRADLRMQGRTVVDFAGERTPALHLRGTLHRMGLKPGEKYTPRPFQVWFTDDERRLPIRVEGEAAFGTFRLLLEEHRVQPTCFD